MKTGAQIVAHLKSGALERVKITDYIHWPIIEAALLAYDPPKSALRTILDRIAAQWNSGPLFTCNKDEIAAARAELDELEAKR